MDIWIGYDTEAEALIMEKQYYFNKMKWIAFNSPIADGTLYDVIDKVKSSFIGVDVSNFDESRFPEISRNLETGKLNKDDPIAYTKNNHYIYHGQDGKYWAKKFEDVICDGEVIPDGTVFYENCTWTYESTEKPLKAEE